MISKQEAVKFEREHRIHETRETKGFINRLSSPSWLVHNDRKVQLRTVELVTPFIRRIQKPVVLAVGVGGGGIFCWMWREPGTVRIGIDVNRDVLLNTQKEKGKDHFRAVEGDGCLLPLADASVDVVLFDFVLHHLVGQGEMETSLREGMRVLRPGGFVIAREPSSYSPSGLAMNIANKFHLMHALTGASNFEFALSPRKLIDLFGRYGTVKAVHGLTYLWSHRLPIRLQNAITKSEPYLFSGKRPQWFADFLLYIVAKDKPERGSATRPGVDE